MAQFTGLDELLMIKGITAELLYGLDADRSYEVEEHEENPVGALEELDNNDGQLNRGIAAYLTVHSMERLTNPDGKTKINVNTSNLKKLYRRLRKVLGEEAAKYIILYRQNGPVDSTATDSTATTDDQSEAQSSSLSSTKLDYKIKAKTDITSLLDLVGFFSLGKAISKEEKEQSRKTAATRQRRASKRCSSILLGKTMPKHFKTIFSPCSITFR